MALQTGVLKFTGKMQNVIGYRRNGKYFLRSMPDKVRQTAATRRAARHFGVASRKGKLVRNAFRPQLDIRDGTLVNRLNRLFIQAGPHDFPQLRGFRINRHTGLEKLFTIPPVFTANGALHIPPQELLAQGNNTHVALRLIASRISFAQNRVISTETATTIIGLQPDQPFRGITLNVPVEGDGALIVVLQYHACKAGNGVLYPCGDRRYMAADVINLTIPVTELTNTAFLVKAGRKRFIFRKGAISFTAKPVPGSRERCSSLRSNSTTPLTATGSSISLPQERPERPSASLTPSSRGPCPPV
ncbi:hypothetical protein [uncultured Chitinophaga sp.]|jgi:hypothetical protein|uniref:hypothetical protein n=1 Tax=uncultured Chitinophaga sp. TaxID=339340 RepID=UPI00261CA748|nr:hypothetical protein [uncultured Chitinophaga sp.]